MSGFPNLFAITGTGSPAVLNNMFVSIEQHVDWIGDCIAYLDEHRLQSIEPTVEAVDDWIAEQIQHADICITNDIPLAARCLERGALAIKPNGQPFTENGIGMALANRELMQGLRESGEITGGPRPFSKADRSAFLNRLETTVQAAKRQRDRA